MDSTSLIAAVQAASTLSTLAERINAEHHQAEIDHGQWLPWLTANFEGSTRTARAYMLVAQRWPRLEEAKRQRAANLSIRDVTALTAKPRKPQIGPVKQEQPAPPQEQPLPVDEDFLSTIPELSPEQQFFAFDLHDMSFMVELHPSVKHRGYYHLAVYRDLDTDSAEIVYDRRPVRYDRRLLAYVLEDIHSIKPPAWTSKPASRQEPWFLTAGGIPGRVHHVSAKSLAPAVTATQEATP